MHCQSATALCVEAFALISLTASALGAGWLAWHDDEPGRGRTAAVEDDRQERGNVPRFDEYWTWICGWLPMLDNREPPGDSKP